MADPLDYIIGAGQGIGGVAQAYEDRQPVDRNQSLLMKYAQEVLNGRMDKTQAAVAYHREAGTPGWGPQQDAALQPGALSLPPVQMQRPSQTQSASSFGLSQSTPNAPSAQMTPPVPPLTPPAMEGGMTSSVPSPKLALDFDNITRGQAREIAPQLYGLADRAVARKDNQRRDYLNEIELKARLAAEENRRKEAAKEKDTEMKGSQRLAQIREQHLGKVDELEKVLAQRADARSQQTAVALTAISAQLKSAHEKLAILSTNTDQKVRVDAFNAITRQLQVYSQLEQGLSASMNYMADPVLQQAAASAKTAAATIAADPDYIEAASSMGDYAKGITPENSNSASASVSEKSSVKPSIDVQGTYESNLKSKAKPAPENESPKARALRLLGVQ